MEGRFLELIRPFFAFISGFFPECLFPSAFPCAPPLFPFSRPSPRPITLFTFFPSSFSSSLFSSARLCCNPLITLTGRFPFHGRFFSATLLLPAFFTSLWRVSQCVLKWSPDVCLWASVMFMYIHAWTRFFFLFAAERFSCTCLCMIGAFVRLFLACVHVCVRVCTLRWLKALHMGLHSCLHNE